MPLVNSFPRITAVTLLRTTTPAVYMAVRDREFRKFLSEKILT